MNAAEIAVARAEGFELGQRLAQVEADAQEYCAGYRDGFAAGREVGYGLAEYVAGRDAAAWDAWYRGHKVGTGHLDRLQLLRARAHGNGCRCADDLRYEAAQQRLGRPLDREPLPGGPVAVRPGEQYAHRYSAPRAAGEPAGACVRCGWDPALGQTEPVPVACAPRLRVVGGP